VRSYHRKALRPREWSGLDQGHQVIASSKEMRAEVFLDSSP
jgi:hypothetical protein